MAQCSNCGSPLSDAQEFCGTCGTPVAAEAAAAAPEAAAAAAPAVPPDVTPPVVPTPPAVPTPPPTFAPPTYAPPAYPPQGYPAGAGQAPRKSRKRLWIGLAAAALVIAVACVLVFAVFWDQIRGGGSEASALRTLAASWTASQSTTDMSGTYEIGVTIDLDTSQMSTQEAAMAQQFLGSPITASGNFAFTQSPVGLDFSVAASLLGQNIDAGIRLLDGKPWINYQGQWYEAPPDLEQQMADSGVGATAGQLKQLFTNLSIDPSSWLKDMKEAGDENINGTDTVHLTGSPDLVKMMTDVTQLMQSQEGQNLLNLAGTASADSSTAVSIPTAAEIEQLSTQLEEMIQDAKVDLWIAKDDNRLRKITIDARIVPPAGDATANSSALSALSALKGIGLTATVTLSGDNAVTIEAPAGALPFADLENALGAEGGILGGLLGG